MTSEAWKRKRAELERAKARAERAPLPEEIEAEMPACRAEWVGAHITVVDVQATIGSSRDRYRYLVTLDSSKRLDPDEVCELILAGREALQKEPPQPQAFPQEE